MSLRSRTITMTVKRKTGEVFDAVLDAPAKMMPDAKKDPDGWWSFTASRGPARLKFNENKQLGILDHTFVDAQARWNVPMRIISSGETSEIVVTLVKPKNLTDEQFDERSVEIQDIMNSMKEIIEKKSQRYH